MHTHPIYSGQLDEPRTKADHWPPPWLAAAAAAAEKPAKTPEKTAISSATAVSPPPPPNGPQTPRTADQTADRTADQTASDTEFYFSQMLTADYRYITAKRDYPEACVWCGGRLRHNRLCDAMRRTWEPTIPFGKYRGRKVAEVPADYLRWLLKSERLLPDLRAAIESRLATV